MLDVLSIIMKVACIDLDNTLAYTSKMHLLSFKKAFEDYNLKPVPDKKILHLFGLISEQMIKKLYPTIDKKLIPKITKKHNEIAVKETYIYARHIPGANEALRSLKSNGYKIAIVSNSSLKEVKRVVKQIGLKNYDKLIAKNHKRKSKPAPDGINFAKKLFNAKEAIMVGDTPYDILAGKRAKAITIAVATGEHSTNELKRYNPDFVIKSIAHINKVL